LTQRGKLLHLHRSAYPKPVRWGGLPGSPPSHPAAVTPAVGRATSVCCQGFHFDLQRPPGAFALRSVERVPGRQGVRVAWLREPQSAGSCCRDRYGFSCRRIRASSSQGCRAGT